MKKLILAFIAAVSFNSFAAPNLDKDGVPVVDVHGTIIKSTDPKAIAFAKEWGFQVPSKRMILVGDKQIPIREFILTYCQGKIINETCVRASKIQAIDNASGPTEKLPKGL